MEVQNRLVEYIQTNREQLVNEWTEKIINMEEQKISSVLTEQVYMNICDEYINILITHFMSEDKHLNSKIGDFSQKMVQFGWNIGFIMDCLAEFGRILFKHMRGEASDKELVELGCGYDRLVTPINKEVLNHYALSWKRTLSRQKIALQELSAPLIPIFNNISVMPLVGTIDTERAKRIMENLLHGVVIHRSEVVLIDITGVPVVDTMVAHHIIQASEAVRLIGSKCLIVGIQPEIAQTIVNLGINLNQVITKNTLQKGVEAALEMTNRKVVTEGE